MELTMSGAGFQHVFRWLSPWNFWTRQQDILSQRVSDTGKWLLENEIFIQWKSHPSGTLLCYGPPGVGKSVLASVMVDYLQSHSPSKSRVLAAYCDRSDASKHKHQDLLGSLLE
jgi:ABC-type molybdenum transport system ATPase subunit/photorepair protein PhrA